MLYRCKTRVKNQSFTQLWIIAHVTDIVETRTNVPVLTH